ncbi:MAG: hypothetical protein LBE71_00625 [Dysgonamonadaceae bacterium]|nr:hypothetical protein [Dysgonamonadaceae bacterium]
MSFDTSLMTTTALRPHLVIASEAKQSGKRANQYVKELFHITITRQR